MQESEASELGRVTIISPTKLYTLLYSEQSTGATMKLSPGSKDTIVVTLNEPRITKRLVLLSDADAVVIQTLVGKNVRTFYPIWERLCRQQTMPDPDEYKEIACVDGKPMYAKPIVTLVSIEAL